ncbi:translesion error-prone DNA polymerase V autoproteolytic subunit [Fodinibius sp. Rm-B-1B1-1]|uniref:LexA family protein n=1 Tax=Fodinibius alkaliphilus TaxID=3140241 RepID=UPI003159B41A
MEDFRITDIYSGDIDRQPERDDNRFRKETGFPSPARDHFEKPLSLDDYIIKRPAATFFMRVKGDGLNGIGIFSDDILVIDRSIKPTAKHVIVAILEGEMVVRKLIKKARSMYLATDKTNEQLQKITKEIDFEIWGVVTHTIHKFI